MKLNPTAVKTSSLASLGAIVAVLIVGVAYLSFGVLRIDPFEERVTARMLLRNSGGIGPDAPVLLTGIRVGRVTAVAKTDSGVRVDFRIDGAHRIPASSNAVIENLSGLGEPYLEFRPQTDQGPFIREGQVLDARSGPAPVLIPQLSVRAVEFIDQLDPKSIASLVGTINTALDGTDGDMLRIARANKLLAATILSRTGEIRQLSADLQTMGADMAWAGPALETSGPTWGEFGARLDSLIHSAATLFEIGDAPNDYLTGDGVVPFLERLAAFLTKIGPQMGELAPVVAPMFGEMTSAVGRLDISALISQAVHTIGDDGAIHIRININ